MSEIVQVLEIRQKRCAKRFGVGDCSATGTPKCLQTYATCGDKEAFDLDGVLHWYFTRPGDPAPSTADMPTADDWHGPVIPILSTVRTEPTRVNLGAVRENESPFGLRGTIDVSLQDFEFRNQFGDFYADERDIKGSLGRLLLAWVGEAISQLEMYLYTGRRGEALAEMSVRRYDVTNISPPSGGKWEISGLDPLARATRKKAQFPRATDLRLQNDINDSTTDITVVGAEADVAAAFGNDSFFYGRFGSEIIRYTGHTGADGIWALTGVVRAALGTTAASHAADDNFQRSGHYQSIRYYDMARDLLENHTTVDAAMIPYASKWAVEGGRYLSTLRGTGTFTDPTSVEEVVSIALRDGMFVMWYDERAQEILIKALRQPRETPIRLDERSNIVASSITRAPGERRTRVTIYYDRRDPTIREDETTNYAKNIIDVDGEAEGAAYADGTVRNISWYSPMIRADANSRIVQASFLQRYRETPQYLELRIAGKDRDIAVGDVVEVTSYDVIDRLGAPVTKAWEVIEWEEIDPGFEYRIMCQSFVLFDRPGFIMDNDAPSFADATDAEKVNALYITGNDGLMPDGSKGYVIQ